MTDPAITAALDVVRCKRADGGQTVTKFHSGPIHSSVAGRTDRKNPPYRKAIPIARQIVVKSGQLSGARPSASV